MTDSIFEEYRQLSRKYFHSIWQRARNKEMDSLTEEEQRLAEIMVAHADEYFNQFEFADVMANHEFDPDQEVNPFLHLALHAIAENQVKDRNPIEALQFYNAMLKQKYSRHEALHLLMAILAQILFPVLQGKETFPIDRYRKVLRKYKSQEPEKIIDRLVNDPDLISSDPVSSKVTQVFDEVKSALEDQTFQSIEEAQTFLNAFVGAKNAEGIPEFLGLSPEQMYRLLYQKLTNTSDIVSLNKALSQEDLARIPVVSETVYFLRRLGELQPLKSTVKGNLPRAFVQELHDKFPGFPGIDFPIMSEQDDPKLSALRHILVMCGWLKKRNQYFSLTHSGQKIVKNGFGPEEFFHLLEIYMRRFNWASRGLHPDLEIIQQAALFSCYLLHLKARDYIHAGKLSAFFIQAFPASLNLVERIPYMGPEKVVQNTFTVRFIQRFCEYFGLVTLREEKKEFLKVDFFVRITPLFEKIFQWKLSFSEESGGKP